MYDKGHNSISVRSIMVRIPGSYNSKYIKDENENLIPSSSEWSKAEVKIEQRWMV
jgi:hypothetical protein